MSNFMSDRVIAIIANTSSNRDKLVPVASTNKFLELRLIFVLSPLIIGGSEIIWSEPSRSTGKILVEGKILPCFLPASVSLKISAIVTASLNPKGENEALDDTVSYLKGNSNFERS